MNQLEKYLDMLKRKKKVFDKEAIEKQNELFQLHWNTKSHYCESCKAYLGKENKTIFHDHLLEKSKYPEYRYELWNLYLVCLACHDEKTRGFPTEKHKLAIEKVLEKIN